MVKLRLTHVLVIGAMLVAPVFVLADEVIDGRALQLRQEFKLKQQAIQQEAKQNREVLMQEFKAKRETFKTDAQKRVDALKKKVGEERAKRIEQFFNQMVRKFENAIDRLNNLADRIESRLTKTEAAGNDVSKQRDLLKVARDKITAVETALGDAKTQFGATALSENPRTAFQKVKELVKGVAQKAKDAHRALVDVMNSIKGLRLGDKGTTTPSR
ncbi:MAG: hypothetical protein UW81_C0025G0004 [Candidatus Giovannonibacteria bacterium GW2011_GWC2_44_9]|uniref:Uncharacterized protein n=3 Tax=Candidatus Giovannoniibacteriota TaxID=1752738 RepID=A0A0G1KI03_9BACT|nr:MAG: hypothetical protein UW15_C0028G0004 [Parcubacteria group bacterium GW2011_GWC1_44_10]KKT60310.1 MAG: hypothetical protein UW53_C0002G0062 [Candidatus Giovannonibacteria bacterium GW2011_GWA1_44_25]KKT83125.1 MAG: hypothetical protein UW81_C0025G0004 [Candidatus Giovannonibacteria bacterium GW2011_GWC2_44_9]KKU29662.1 MAG: hypothetical protein UX43_C0007G0004 [Candidatus Giovannonibacteria bacterium GW2011_GWB1_46_20]